MTRCQSTSATHCIEGLAWGSLWEAKAATKVRCWPYIAFVQFNMEEFKTVYSVVCSLSLSDMQIQYTRKTWRALYSALPMHFQIHNNKHKTCNTRVFFFQRHKYYDRIQKDSKGVSFVNTKLFLWVCTDREINEGEYISLLDDVKKAFASFRKRSRSVFMRIKHCFELCLEQTVRLFLVLTFIAIVERN